MKLAVFSQNVKGMYGLSNVIILWGISDKHATLDIILGWKFRNIHF